VVAARSGEPQAVDEILQEVAIAVIDQRSPLKDPAKVAPWLYQVAVRQALMYRRRHGRRRNLERRYGERTEIRSGSEPNPLDWLVADERRDLIRQAMSRLNPKDAEMLMLKYTEDWSYQQIADHLGISESAVDSRLHRARKRLRREMVLLNVIEATV
jgi:RNA polymerase sigma-70 factor (ECF subfamily)